MLRIVIFLLATCCFSLTWASEKVVLAVSLDPPQDNNAKIIEPTIQALKNTFGKDNLEILRLPLPALEECLESGKADLFLSTSGLSRRMTQKGAKELTTMVSDRLPDPNKAYGTLFITRADSPIRTVEDMRNKSVAINLQGGFYGHQIGLGELADRGHDPHHFFGRTEFVGRDLRNVVWAVISGKTDIGLLSTCFLEDTYPKGDKVWQQIKPIGLKPESAVCMSSTKLYPNWSFSSMPGASPEVAKKAILALLTMPRVPGGYSWSIGTDSTRSDELFKSLQLGPFSFLNEWFSQELWNHYSSWIALVLLLLVLFAGTSFVLSKLVKRRTKSLSDSLEKQKILQRKAQKALERAASLEKLGIVEQMSSILAHELRQPFTTIKAFIFGAQRKAQKNALSNEQFLEILQKIQKQTDKLEDIVDHVRSYAKRKQPELKLFDLGEATNAAIENFEDCGNFHGKIKKEIQHGLKVNGSALEIELLLNNLLKNAAESITAISASYPKIAIRLEQIGDHAVLSVSDNGNFSPKQADESTLLTSSKEEGLGLGLLIVKSIARKHGGTFKLEARKAGNGAIATLSLPLIHENKQN